MQLTTRFDEEILEKMRACTKAQFPICLNVTLERIYGSGGKHALDSIVKREKFDNVLISSPKDIWTLYRKYIGRISEVFGEDVAEVIEYESLKDMEKMLCTKCPLYEEKGSDLREIEQESFRTVKSG